MPLDYALWNQIETRTLAKRGNTAGESLASYKKRLNITAKRLPKTIVKKCLAKMKENIQAIYNAEGSFTKMD